MAKARTYYGDTSLVDVQGYPSGLLYSHISGQRDEWYIQFTMPTGKPLAKGIYALAPVADDTHASASVDYNQPGECFGMTGSLNVRNITWDGPTMTGLYATYTLYCEGSTAAYRGTIHAGL